MVIALVDNLKESPRTTRSLGAGAPGSAGHAVAGVWPIALAGESSSCVSERSFYFPGLLKIR